MKKYITSKDENGKLNEWFLAHEYIVDLEIKLQQQEKQIEEYRSFLIDAEAITKSAVNSRCYRLMAHNSLIAATKNKQMMPYNVQPYLHKALCYAFGRL